MDNEKDNSITETDKEINAAKHVKSADLTPKFVGISVSVSVAVIIALSLAMFFIPKSDRALQHGLNSLKKSDGRYLTIKTAYDDTQNENDQLSEELETKRRELEEFTAAKNGLDKIGESNKSLEETRDSLLREADEKQREYDSLTAAADKTVTLQSGYYTAGTDIAAGKYTVTGSGSIAVARSGRSIRNKLLNSDGEEFEFLSDDRIQIDGSAKFVPR